MPRTLKTALRTLATVEHRRLVAWLNRKFPGLGRARAEEAAQDAYLQILACPRLGACAERALAAGGFAAFRRLTYHVAHRALRAQWRRKAWQVERSRPRGLDLVGGLDPETQLTERERRAQAEVAVRARIQGVAEAVNATHRHAIARALCALLTDPDESQQALAARHGVRREYLCRAWRRLLADVDGLGEGIGHPARLAA